MSSLHHAIALIGLLVLISIPSQVAAVPHLELAVSFAPAKATLYGTLRCRLPGNETLSLDLRGLNVTGIVLSEPGNENRQVDLRGHRHLALEAVPEPRTLLLSYEKQVTPGYWNLISPEAIILTSGWHPVPDVEATFELSGTVPPGFTAFSEADRFDRTSPDGQVRFSFSQPVRTIVFGAADYRITSRVVREGLKVHTLFFPEEQPLADSYLEAASSYLERYEALIGPFPYNHYLIVANPMPTGFGLPTLTLLGRQVIRLPFIKDTSLGHEILHSWFGNSVTPDYRSGNWSEGLTTYLADLAYREDDGEGALARKETIQEYFSYVSEDTPPVVEFRTVSHHDPSLRDRRAMGYGRSAMIFHELRRRLGDEQFRAALQSFYRSFKGKTASWDDLRRSFSEVSESSLERFFTERLTRVALPELGLGDISVRTEAAGIRLSFTLEQRGEQPSELLVPIRIRTAAGELDRSYRLDSRSAAISIDLTAQPLELIVDPEYDLMRHLSKPEQYPSWSRLMGSDDTLVVLAEESLRQRYRPLLEWARERGWKIALDHELAPEDETGRNLIFLGSAARSRALFASPSLPTRGFTMDVRAHPLAAGFSAALVHSAGEAETAAALPRLRHYGRYAYLHFEQGRIQEKRALTARVMGIRHTILAEPVGYAVTSLDPFELLADQLATRRVVYLGETHTSRADHLLQQLVIEALHARNPNLAIGMEMFPRSSQPALDRYVLEGTLSEADFLKQSRYFEVWGFDYRLFRPIFALARHHRIPVIGLNLDRNLVSSVYRNGGIDGLEAAQRQLVPADRDLGLPGYTERLRRSFEHHGSFGADGGGTGSLRGFVESQALWDEYMAESIETWLLAHPESSMIVLAGSQHTRKDSGIPPRLARRLELDQTVVVSSASAGPAEELGQTADFVLFLEAADFPEPGKIGVILEKTAAGAPGLEITEFSPGGRAASAGLRLGDRIIRVDSLKIDDLTDIRTALLDKRVGETVSIMVQREHGSDDAEPLTLEVELSRPSAPRPHP